MVNSSLSVSCAPDVIRDPFIRVRSFTKVSAPKRNTANCVGIPSRPATDIQPSKDYQSTCGSEITRVRSFIKVSAPKNTANCVGVTSLPATDIQHSENYQSTCGSKIASKRKVQMEELFGTSPTIICKTRKTSSTATNSTKRKMDNRNSKYKKNLIIKKVFGSRVINMQRTAEKEKVQNEGNKAVPSYKCQISPKKAALIKKIFWTNTQVKRRKC